VRSRDDTGGDRWTAATPVSNPLTPR
jgi:hypothetical protein